MRLLKLIHLGKERFRGVHHKLGRDCASIMEIILVAFKQLWIYVNNVVTFQTTFQASRAFLRSDPLMGFLILEEAFEAEADTHEATIWLGQASSNCKVEAIWRIEVPDNLRCQARQAPSHPLLCDGFKATKI